MFNQTAILLQTVLHILSLRPELRATNVTNNDTNTKLVPEWYEQTSKSTGEETFKCQPPYGCFSVETPWPINRPVNYFPEPAAKIKPGFCLFTRYNKDKCQTLIYNKTGTIFKSNFRGEKQTYFIIHGYLESGNKTWIKTMAHELLKADDGNVIAVDWQGGSGPPYSQAVANTRLVGRAVAMLINKLKEEVGLKVDACHIIGHSLGSHTAGYAGHALAQWGLKLGRITGLDPAEPHFVDTHTEVRLDPSDATYVDVVHTDAAPFISGGFGLQQPVGHLDFYPNGGESQPGCNSNVMNSITQEKGSFILGIRRAIGCNHVRSYEFFTESINSKCNFQAVECESWAKFESGDCFSCPSTQYYNAKPACAKFGFHSKPITPRNHVQMFFKTAESYPFCRHHYRVELQISNSTSSFAHGGEVGEFWLELHGTTGHTERIRLQETASYFEPGSRRRRVVGGAMVGQLEAATVEWVFRSSMWNPLTWRLIATPQIYLESLRVDVLETRESLHLCPGNDPLLSGRPRTFTTPRNKCPQIHPSKH